MASAPEQDHIIGVDLEVDADAGKLDFDASPEEAEAITEALSEIFEGAIHAAWAAAAERFPDLNLTISIDGFRFGR